MLAMIFEATNVIETMERKFNQLFKDSIKTCKSLLPDTSELNFEKILGQYIITIWWPKKLRDRVSNSLWVVWICTVCVSDTNTEYL